MTTEALTTEQRTEVRRTLLQSIAEMGRGLELAGLLLKQGKFASARDTITGTEAMLVLHEGMAQLLLKENQRLTDHVTALEQTADDDEPTHEGWDPEHFRVAGCDGSLHPGDCLGNTPSPNDRSAS